MKKLKSLIAAFLLVTVLNSVALACGPFSLDPLFSFTKHPDYPLVNYTQGKLGIVPPTFGRASLFAAYRELNNLNFTPSEQAALTELWRERIEVNRRSDNDNAEQSAQPSGGELWQATRKRVLGETAAIEIGYERRVPSQDNSGYNFYFNCYDDAFANAARTLDRRIAQYGANNPDVREWLAGQDAVFSNCTEGAALPASLDQNAARWLVKDREYQIAAAHFYIGNFSEARQRFERIAADKNAENSRLANYLVARTFIREASLIDSEDKSPPIAATVNDLYRNAEAHLQKILNDAAMSEFHDSSRGLLNLIKYRLHPVERLRELPEKLLRPSENPDLRDELTDYLWLLEKVERDAYSSGEEKARSEAKQAGKETIYDYSLRLRDLPASISTHDLTDWLFVYQIEDADAFLYSLKKYRETNKTHWFLAAISKADATKNPDETAALLAEVGKIPESSPAYPTATFHQIRLLLEQDKRALARRQLDRVFAASFAQLPLSSQNKFLAQRMNVAENLNEFLKYAQRKPVAFVWSDDANQAGEDLAALKKSDQDYITGNVSVWAQRTTFDYDAAEILNRDMPLATLRQAALKPDVPEHLRKFLAIAVWTRAFIIRDEKIANEFAPVVLRLAPEYKAFFARYANAADPVEREAAALLAVLRYPVIEPFVETGYGREAYWEPTTIDSIRGNWWCAPPVQPLEDYQGVFARYKFKPLVPEFLTATEKSTAEREQAQLRQAGNSATYLARRAVEFAEKNLTHKDTAEILHLAVRATRYGCTDEATGRYSKAAFDLLKKNFPNSEWTKKTPYWFK